MWPIVRSRLPPPPATVIDLGCGPAGGYVPQLLASGYDATGIDPNAPDGSTYLRVEFERADLPDRVDAIVASTSLHHVADPGQVVDRIAGALRPPGTLVVIEWDWRRFDLATATWCFQRLTRDGNETFLSRHRDGWLASGVAWEAYLHGWAAGHGLHPPDLLLPALDRRFQRLYLGDGPYVFPYLPGVGEGDELAAIRAGEVAAMRVDYAGTLRTDSGEHH